ncbi:MAG: hypothetical protein S4CHLAM102_04580 [Chlamydiia bacterium]|nr:hypothetical protein [Chlamydiia bacterium]
MFGRGKWILSCCGLLVVGLTLYLSTLESRMVEDRSTADPSLPLICEGVESTKEIWRTHENKRSVSFLYSPHSTINFLKKENILVENLSFPQIWIEERYEEDRSVYLMSHLTAHSGVLDYTKQVLTIAEGEIERYFAPTTTATNEKAIVTSGQIKTMDIQLNQNHPDIAIENFTLELSR